MISGLIKLINSISKALPPCLFRKITGLYCPGCGGTRAVKALILGHPLISFIYHPIVLYSFCVFLVFIIRYFKIRIIGKDKTSVIIPVYIYWVALAIVIINWIVKIFLF